MLSTCPSCLNQIHHEDHLFEIICECGTRFQPFLTNTEAIAEPEPALGATSYESAEIFAEIRQFGETLIEPEVSPSSKAAVPTSQDSQSNDLNSNSIAITSTEHLPSHVIEALMGPVSVLVNFTADDQDPIRNALPALTQRCKTLGGNGIVGLRMTPSADPSKLLVWGTVVVSKKVTEH